MENNESLLTKASDVCTFINAMSEHYSAHDRQQKKLIVSFDVYCLLLEYTALLNQTHQNGGSSSLEELIVTTDLVYETRRHQLTVCVDFFSTLGSVEIE